MKKTRKILLSTAMLLCIGGCGKESCNCPSDIGNPSEQQSYVINDYSELYKKTAPSVVMVRIQRKSDKGSIIATGSGVVAYEEGNYAYVYTNAHVLKDMTSNYEIEIIFSNEDGIPSGESEVATLVAKDPYEDVAVLEIRKSSKYTLAVKGDSDKLDKGDWVYTIGTPLDRFNYTTSGNIAITKASIDLDSSKTGVSTPVYAIMFDAAINEGNSGGALFDSEGKLIGITTLRYDNVYGMYGALPINYFDKVAKHLMVNETNYVRPTLNLDLISIDDMGTRRDEFGISSFVNSGVYIKHSVESSLLADTVITEVNGVKVRSVVDFKVELLKYSIGDAVTLTVINKDGLNARTITLILHI